MKHLTTMQQMIKGRPTEQKVISVINKLLAMTVEFKAFDYWIVRQQMYKFFEDTHIKVSFFIKDEIQSKEGTIFLDFCGVGPLHSQAPGRVTFFDEQSG